MTAKDIVVHEAAGEITLIEIRSLENALPISADTYLRILFGLAMNGSVQLPGKMEANASIRSTRQ